MAVENTDTNGVSFHHEIRDVATIRRDNRSSRHRLGDRIFRWLVTGIGCALTILLILIAVFLAKSSWPTIQKFGIQFVFSSEWDPVLEVFGALPVIFGTAVTAALAILMATPIAVAVALFLVEMATPKLAAAVGFLIEMLAAIPSVVYGLWGIFVLVPYLRTEIQPMVGDSLGFIPLFTGPYYGVGLLAAGITLAIMITPTITAICREIFSQIPRHQREAARALGATEWETMKLAVLPASRSGIIGAIILGLGRALGETMAVTMVIGNRAEISASLFAPAQTMASVIANEYAEATSDMHVGALTYIGLILFALAVAVNAIARLVIYSGAKKVGAR